MTASFLSSKLVGLIRESQTPAIIIMAGYATWYTNQGRDANANPAICPATSNIELQHLKRQITIHCMAVVTDEMSDEQWCWKDDGGCPAVPFLRP